MRCRVIQTQITRKRLGALLVGGVPDFLHVGGMDLTFLHCFRQCRYIGGTEDAISVETHLSTTIPTSRAAPPSSRIVPRLEDPPVIAENAESTDCTAELTVIAAESGTTSGSLAIGVRYPDTQFQ